VTFHRTEVFNGTTTAGTFTSIDLSDYVGSQRAVVMVSVVGDANSDIVTTFRSSEDSTEASLNGWGASTTRSWQGHAGVAWVTTNATGSIQFATGADETSPFAIDLIMHIE